LGRRFPGLARIGLIGLTKLGISGGPLVHGPTVAHLKSTVKVGCHKTKINICGKSWGGGGWERVVGVEVSGGSVGDSRNGNGSWSLVLQGVRRFPQEQSSKSLVDRQHRDHPFAKCAKGWGTRPDRGRRGGGNRCGHGWHSWWIGSA